ncbi:hypothetical protein GYMLUDRAFT_251146 [Collybiopsis luxurians FD-317 M1]|uniref:Uncharacterized protein n=1 Tax=Collybiopsis luxurians FD-317 M1 TaxID=944289 RepID=A0A0D0BSH0_9AGAR|nr:hypothetical protein GYMLUDRAFT_251146 [Collybiopsis luxurians FD-317 M1]
MSAASEDHSTSDLQVDSDEEMEGSLDSEGEEEADEEENEGSATPPINPGSSTFFNSEMASWDNFQKMRMEQVKAICQCITDVMLPSWIEHPPGNLGESKHGKLKAHQLWVLFSIIFPLIIPEFWFNGDEVENLRLENFCHLVASLNLLAAYSTSEKEADEFQGHFISYRRTMKDLHPGFPSMPNHHYSMHFPQLMKFWGPMGTLSEFPGEHLNGQLQRIPTNNHFVDMELTMIQQYSRKSKLQALLHEPSNLKVLLGNSDSPLEKPTMEELIGILESHNVYSFMDPPKSMTDSEVAAFLAKASEFEDCRHYSYLLAYLNMHDSHYHSAYSLYIPMNSLVLPTAVQSHRLKELQIMTKLGIEPRSLPLSGDSALTN